MLHNLPGWDPSCFWLKSSLSLVPLFSLPSSGSIWAMYICWLSFLSSSILLSLDFKLCEHMNELGSIRRILIRNYWYLFLHYIRVFALVLYGVMSIRLFNVTLQQLMVD